MTIQITGVSLPPALFVYLTKYQSPLRQLRLIFSCPAPGTLLGVFLGFSKAPSSASPPPPNTRTPEVKLVYLVHEVERHAFAFWNLLNSLSQEDIVKLNSKKKRYFYY